MTFAFNVVPTGTERVQYKLEVILKLIYIKVSKPQVVIFLDI